MLAATTIVGGRAGVGGARARARFKVGLLCSVAITAHLGVDSGPRGWSRNPEGIGFLLGVKLSQLGVSEARGFGASLLSWFNFFLVCIPWLETGLGWWGWSCTTELVPLLSKCVYRCHV